MILSEDLTSVSSFLDVKRNREYIHQGDQAPLFRIGIAGNMDSPEYLTSQLLYFFDSEGGIYYAAYDGNGYHKNLSLCRRASGSISMTRKI